MGFLQDLGLTYDYYESLAFQQHIKEKSIIQFLLLLQKFGNFHIFNHTYDSIEDQDHFKQQEESKDVQKEETKEEQKSQPIQQMKLIWGDEFEGHIVKVFSAEKKILLQPNTSMKNYKNYFISIDKIFQLLEEHRSELCFIPLPEFGAWMLETTPNKPYQSLCFNMDQVLKNMRLRLKQIQESLKQDTYILLLPVYPFLGVGQFSVTVGNDLQYQYMEKLKAEQSYLEKTPTLKQASDDQLAGQIPQDAQNTPLRKQTSEPIVNDYSESIYFDDRLINPHPRYSTLCQNIRLRRRRKIEIKIPIYIDEKTSMEKTEFEPNPGFITMDHMGFGMGNCALQMTFLSIDIDHARFLYDQFAILSPLFLALSAGSPIFKGKLANTDIKWNCLEQSVDCRTVQEQDPNHPSYIPKSRYSSVSYFISNSKLNLPQYNDLPFPRNQEIMNFAKQKAQEMNVELDDKLLNHLGILTMRDNLAIFKDKVYISDEETTSHFEAIQSTNWNSARFKPPPSYNSKIGWRVEFRTTEIQLTADENAAYSILLLMIVRMFFKPFFKLNFYIPLSLVDKNFERAKDVNAILTQKFYFRTNIQDEGEPKIEELTLSEIFFGKQSSNYLGIQALYESFRIEREKSQCCLNTSDIVQKNKEIEDDVFNYFKGKCTGKIKTLASYIRGFVMNHPTYGKDSIVTEVINFELLSRLIQISLGQIQDAEFPRIFRI